MAFHIMTVYVCFGNTEILLLCHQVWSLFVDIFRAWEFLNNRFFIYNKIRCQTNTVCLYFNVVDRFLMYKWACLFSAPVP